MPTFASHPHGTPGWVDLMAPDVDAAKAFYTSIFDWEVDDQTDPDGAWIYTIFRKGGQAVAGLGGQPPMMAGAPAVWNSYVIVDDADAVLGSVEEAGGKVVMPAMDVFTSGRMGVMSDPAGAMISVWQAGDMTGAEVCNEPDTYSWNELMTRDVAGVQPFYERVFGWEFNAMDMGPMGTYHVVRGGENGGLAGMMAMPEEMPDQVPNHWVVYFNVADVDATLEKITAGGGSITNGPMDAPGVGRMANAHDPQFGSFALMRPEDLVGESS